MIQLHRLGTLDVSAASGCVVREGRVLVVADDDVTLRTYALDGAHVDALRLFPDALPGDAKARKAAKPDLEALAVLPGGALLALGSGSSERRRRAAWVRDREVRIVDCAPLFARLAHEFSELNVEGLAVHGQHLLLAQRGNGAKRENALVRLSLAGALAALERGVFEGSLVEAVERVELGALNGVALSLTDLAVGPDGGLHFSAAAEDTDDPYLDGACAGSVIGRVEGGRVAWARPVDAKVKLEGLAWLDERRWVAVADPDDPSVSAPFFSVTL